MYNIAIGMLAAVLYLVSGTLLGVRLSRTADGVSQSKTGLVALASIAALLHALLLAQIILQPGGMNLGFFNALSLAGWLIAVILLLLATLRPVENLGIVLLPFSAITILLALFFPSQRMLDDSMALPWPLEVHIVTSIIAYALLAMAAVQALLLAVQDNRLRHHHPGGFLRGIPPLTTMESLLFQMITAGFIALSLALLSGLLFLEDIFAQHLVHKTTLSVTAWLVFGVLLWGRWHFGWRGRIAIRWTLGGFIILMLAYFGSKLVLELILQRVS